MIVGVRPDKPAALHRRLFCRISGHEWGAWHTGRAGWRMRRCRDCGQTEVDLSV